MERNEISIHELRIVEFVRFANRWVTAREISTQAQVGERTAKHHALSLVKLGVFDQAEVFPAHRYRLSDRADKRNKGYMIRIEKAREVFGINKQLAANGESK